MDELKKLNGNNNKNNRQAAASAASTTTTATATGNGTTTAATDTTTTSGALNNTGSTTTMSQQPLEWRVLQAVASAYFGHAARRSANSDKIFHAVPLPLHENFKRYILSYPIYRTFIIKTLPAHTPSHIHTYTHTYISAYIYTHIYTHTLTLRPLFLTHCLIHLLCTQTLTLPLSFFFCMLITVTNRNHSCWRCTRRRPSPPLSQAHT